MEVEHLGSEEGLATVGERDLEFGISAELIITKVELRGDSVSVVTCLDKIIVVITNDLH